MSQDIIHAKRLISAEQEILKHPRLVKEKRTHEMILLKSASLVKYGK